MKKEILEEKNMHKTAISSRKLLISTLVTFMAILTLIVSPAVLTINNTDTHSVSTDPGLTITGRTDKSTYLLRQEVKINGNISQNGSPATNLVVAMQINTPLNSPLAFRAFPIGTPTQTWPLNITNLSLMDTANNPLNTVKIGSSIAIGMSLYNPQATSRSFYGGLTIFDANMVPIVTRSFSGMINPFQTISQGFSADIPLSATSGRSLIIGTVFTSQPKTGGRPLALEKTAYFAISKVQQGLMQYPQLPLPPAQTTPGKYSTNITLPPDPTPGNYGVYLTADYNVTSFGTTSTQFAVQTSTGYPPQASFAFWPAAPYQNQTTLFDASSSTPEGFNDSITSYKWNFGDGTSPSTMTTPTINHEFRNIGTFTVSLNVTDKGGLWSYTSKPITILPPFGPTARFKFSPSTPGVNGTVTFDAGNTTTGWSARTKSFSPIVSYVWNFGDGKGNFTVTNPILNRNFTKPGNFTVKLTVFDADSRTSTASALIQVLNVTGKPYDLNGDHFIDMSDIVIVARAYGTAPGDKLWNPIADVNHDGFVDMSDIALVAVHYGQDP